MIIALGIVGWITGTVLIGFNAKNGWTSIGAGVLFFGAWILGGQMALYLHS